jgi:hypothetical protein
MFWPCVAAFKLGYLVIFLGDISLILLERVKIMIAKKIVFISMALVLWGVPTIVFAAGAPFDQLQQQIDQLKTQLQNIQRIPGPQGPQGPVGPTGPQGPPGGAGGVTHLVYGSLNSDATLAFGTGISYTDVQCTSDSCRYSINFTHTFTPEPACMAYYPNPNALSGMNGIPDPPEIVLLNDGSNPPNWSGMHVDVTVSYPTGSGIVGSDSNKFPFAIICVQ